jgi:hypothetical protein
MPFELNLRLAGEIGSFMWRVPIGNAMAATQWGGSGAMMASVLGTIKKGDGEIVKLSKIKEVGSASAAEDPRVWEDLGKQVFRQIANLEDTKAKLAKSRPGVSFGFRCNQFAACMIYLIKLNRNFETTAEIIRIGADTSNCHYMILLDREKSTSTVSGSIISNDKATWGPEHILLDPWGAKQRKPAWAGTRETGVSGPTEKFYVFPHEFGNKTYSICEWQLPQPRYINNITV